MPDISILVDIADYYDISIPEIVNEEKRKTAKIMSDYATTEKENIFKEMRIQSIMGVCALVFYLILHETGAYMYNDVLGKLTGYCETLVFVTVILMAAFTTDSLSELRSKSRNVFMLENFPKPISLIAIAVVAFAGAAIIKLALVHFLCFFRNWCAVLDFKCPSNNSREFFAPVLRFAQKTCGTDLGKLF